MCEKERQKGGMERGTYFGYNPGSITAGERHSRILKYLVAPTIKNGGTE